MEQPITPFSILLSRIQGGRKAQSVLDVAARIGCRAARSSAACRRWWDSRRCARSRPDAPLRSLQVTFLAPVPGGLVRRAARILRSGKSATHVEARIVDGDNTLAMMVGVFGTPRSSAVALRPRQPDVTPDNPMELPWVPGVTPNFTRHFKARWVAGARPWSGIQRPDSVIELAMRDQGNATEYHVVAMADFIPPIALSYLKTPVPAASLTWMLEVLIGRRERAAARRLENRRADERRAQRLHQPVVDVVGTRRRARRPGTPDNGGVRVEVELR
jgi:hypothetical protein